MSTRKIWRAFLLVQTIFLCVVLAVAGMVTAAEATDYAARGEASEGRRDKLEELVQGFLPDKLFTHEEKEDGRSSV